MTSDNKENGSGVKSFIEKLFDDSLIASKHLKKIIENITCIATETKKITETLLRLNERVNQHEKTLLVLMSIVEQQYKNQNKDVVDYTIKPQKKEPKKPN